MAAKYKMIIVDDEYLVRRGIRETIDWSALDVEIVAECENGKQAIAAVERFQPDLIISDVRMPVMDGLAMAETLAERKFDGAIIFYSGYSDFEYVRKAMEYGVSGYVLKPEENEQLTKKTAETIAALEERRKQSNALQSLASGASYIKEIYFHKLEEGVDDQSLRDQLSVLNIFIPDSGTVVYGKALRILDAAFENFYHALMRSLENFKAVGYLSREKFLIVTGLIDLEALRECAERLFGECGNNTSFACIGLSDAFGLDISLCTAVARAKAAASPVFEVGGVFFYSEEGMRGGKQLKKIVEDAIALIVEHYSEKITVKWVADKLFISESHLMHEFKEETGATFNECLTYYRIAKAKELLSQGKMRINEIAAAVGFSDGRYFGQVFKERVGITPSEYIDLIHEKN